MILENLITTLRLRIEGPIRRLLGQYYMRTGKCRGCGGCCRDMKLLYKNWKITEASDFAGLVAEDPLYERFQPKAHPDGAMTFTCRFIGSDNRCSDYRNRPGACRDYPDPSLIQRFGGEMINGCGYRVFLLVSFSDVLSQEMGNSDSEPS